MSDFTYSGDRAPYQDSLRLGKFSKVAKVTEVAVTDVAVGDTVILYDEKDNIISYNGVSQQYVTKVTTTDSGTQLTLVPASPTSAFSTVETPPYNE